MERWNRVEQRLLTEAYHRDRPDEVQRELESGERHPFDPLLREDRIPHMWCSGCGLGTALTCFLSALVQTEYDLNKVSVVSGIGCTGRVAGYVRLDSFHTTHGRAIPFATGLKLANPELKVVVMSGDGDLIAIGGNHFIHAARRNLDITVICVNNLNYGMTGGQVAPTTPVVARTSTSPYGNYEPPFNLPYLAAASGAVYVSRWTTLHVHQLEHALIEALDKKGFSFVEIISPCPTLYGRGNRLGNGLNMMRYYRDKSVIRHGSDPRDADIYFGGPITVGNFINVDRPSYLEFRDWLWEESNYGKKRDVVLKKLGEQRTDEGLSRLARRQE
jgi:2-oxoglutarate ferredoxin oxidoreductase subunit beta